MVKYLTEYTGSDNKTALELCRLGFIISEDSAIDLLCNYYEVESKYKRSVNRIQTLIKEHIDFSNLYLIEGFSGSSEDNDDTYGELKFLFGRLNPKYLSVTYKKPTEVNSINIDGYLIQNPVEIFIDLFNRYILNTSEAVREGLPPIKSLYYPYLESLAKVIKLRDDTELLAIMMKDVDLSNEARLEYNKLVL